MNREILFRGKRELDGKWIYGLYSDDYVYETDFPCIMPLRSGNDYEDWSVIRETVGQYTGLTDKNGNRIFDGDIVRTKCFGKDNGSGCNFNDYDIFKVVYEPAAYRIETARRSFYLGNYDNMAKKLEVIGNIHDNPELLEVDNGDM